MQANRSRDSRPEIEVRTRLHRDGFRYRVAFRPLPDLRRTADIAFTRVKIAVFMDGCFWHACPEHGRMAAVNTDYWRTKLARNRARDAETNEILAMRGWDVLRFWEHEDRTQIVMTIESAVQAKRALLGYRRR